MTLHAILSAASHVFADFGLLQGPQGTVHDAQAFAGV